MGLVLMGLVLLVGLLIAIETAKGRRAKCRWSREQADRQQWLAVIGLFIVVWAAIFGPFVTPEYRPNITETVAFILCIYLLTKAVCRKRDLVKNAIQAPLNHKPADKRAENGTSGIPVIVTAHGIATVVIGASVLIAGIAESVDSRTPDERLLFCLWFSGIALVICGIGLIKKRAFGVKALYAVAILPLGLPLAGSLRDQGAFIWHLIALLVWGLPAVTYYRSHRMFFS